MHFQLTMGYNVFFLLLLHFNSLEYSVKHVQENQESMELNCVSHICVYPVEINFLDEDINTKKT
jgi:hypothetical protein